MRTEMQRPSQHLAMSSGCKLSDNEDYAGSVSCKRPTHGPSETRLLRDLNPTNLMHKRLAPRTLHGLRVMMMQRQHMQLSQASEPCSRKRTHHHVQAKTCAAAADSRNVANTAQRLHCIRRDARE